MLDPLVVALTRERRMQGMSQKTLAEAAGLSENVVGYMERGERSPSLDTIRAICEALSCDLELVYRGE